MKVLRIYRPKLQIEGLKLMQQIAVGRTLCFSYADNRQAREKHCGRLLLPGFALFVGLAGIRLRVVEVLRLLLEVETARSVKKQLPSTLFQRKLLKVSETGTFSTSAHGEVTFLAKLVSAP